MLRLMALAVLTTLAIAAPAPATGAYVGAGPSTDSDASGECYELTTLTIAPNALRPGLWHAELDCVVVGTFNSDSFAAPGRIWPALFMDELTGTPATGFTDSGWAFDDPPGSPNSTWWRVTVGPIGEATPWTLEKVFYAPDGPQPWWWQGVADFEGAHV